MTPQELVAAVKKLESIGVDIRDCPECHKPYVRLPVVDVEIGIIPFIILTCDHCGATRFFKRG